MTPKLISMHVQWKLGPMKSILHTSSTSTSNILWSGISCFLGKELTVTPESPLAVEEHEENGEWEMVCHVIDFKGISPWDLAQSNTMKVKGQFEGSLSYFLIDTRQQSKS